VLLILRDEDIETVGSAITAVALQHGLEPVDPATQGQDILSVAASLLGPRVVLAQGEDFVLVDGLASLGLGDADLWGATLSGACSNEIIAVEPSPNGIRVAVFDDGELDESIAVDVDPSGTTRSEELADIVPSDEAAEELREGIAALNAVELATQVLRLFDAGEEAFAGEPRTLSFHDPNDDDASS
jgi:hypothetical protein